jgi:alkylhydroperoxidase family enzyme
MEERLHYTKVSPGAYPAMLGLEKYLHECGLEIELIHLIKLRSSQINGCAFCLDMHLWLRRLLCGLASPARNALVTSNLIHTALEAQPPERCG